MSGAEHIKPQDLVTNMHIDHIKISSNHAFHIHTILYIHRRVHIERESRRNVHIERESRRRVCKKCTE